MALVIDADFSGPSLFKDATSTSMRDLVSLQSSTTKRVRFYTGMQVGFQRRQGQLRIWVRRKRTSLGALFKVS